MQTTAVNWSNHLINQLPQQDACTDDETSYATFYSDTMSDISLSEDQLTTIADLLADEYAKAVLEEISRKPMTIPELTTHLDASRTTVYRRIQTLSELDLVESQIRPEPGGTDATAYAATLSEITIILESGSFEAEVTHTDTDAVDRLNQLWGDL
jgi:predicted transcriptional regulator